MSNKTYSRPDFTMMRFALSDNVADSSCDVYNKVTIPCLITGTHDLFNSTEICGSGNIYSELGSSRVTVSSTLYFMSDLQAIDYLSGKTVQFSTSYSQQYDYELTAGEYLVWTSGQTHAALITSSVSHGINASV